VAELLGSKHNAVTDARDKAANAAQAAAYAAAARDRKDVIPIVSPVEEVIAQGLVSLAIAGDIISEGSHDQVSPPQPHARRPSPWPAALSPWPAAQPLCGRIALLCPTFLLQTLEHTIR
jgi:hypothetical protein